MAPLTRAAARARVAWTPLDALPAPVARHVFSLLPVDARMLCACVCRSWRALLADHTLWTRLDTTTTAVAVARAASYSDPNQAVAALLLRAAAARTGGQLAALRTSVMVYPLETALDELLAVIAANAGSLRELSIDRSFGCSELYPVQVAQLLHNAPGLRLLETAMLCDGPEVLQILKNEPPYGPLRLTGLTIGNCDLQHNPPADWLAVAAALAAHRALESVGVWHRNWPHDDADCDALVDALLALPLLHTVYVSSTPRPHALARLLCKPTLTNLSLSGEDGNMLLFPRGPAASLCLAMHANTQLGRLSIGGVRFWYDMLTALCFLHVLAEHPSLHTFSLSDNAVPPEDAAAAGAALGVLVARAPSLRKLDITRTSLRNTGMLPFLNALPEARCLRELVCPANRMSNAFARDCLLPAVMACAPLRVLWSFKCDAAREAERLLKLRCIADALKEPAMSATA